MRAVRLAAATLLIAGVTTTGEAVAQQDLGALFAPASRDAEPISAADMVEGAYANLFAPGYMMSIQTVRTDEEGNATNAEFRVLRRQVDDGVRILTESLAPANVEGTRVLQIERAGAAERTFAFVRSIGREPFETTFRLADPFLCTWYEREEGAAPVAPDDPTERTHEILGRRPDTMAGEPVQRITVRPEIARGYDRIELAIAERDLAILEYLHYVLPEDTEPSLIARVDRKDMIEFDGRILPTVLRYEDRMTNEVVFVTVTHSTLPPDLSNLLFEPRSFPRALSDRVLDTDAP